MLSDDAHVAQTAELFIGNNNVALCSFARLLQAYRLLGLGADILWHPGLGASYGMLQLCGIVSYDKSKTTSGMKFVTILSFPASDRRYKYMDFLNSKPTALCTSSKLLETSRPFTPFLLAPGGRSCAKNPAKRFLVL